MCTQCTRSFHRPFVAYTLTIMASCLCQRDYYRCSYEYVYIWDPCIRQTHSHQLLQRKRYSYIQDVLQYVDITSYPLNVSSHLFVWCFKAVKKALQLSTNLYVCFFSDVTELFAKIKYVISRRCFQEEEVGRLRMSASAEALPGWERILTNSS